MEEELKDQQPIQEPQPAQEEQPEQEVVKRGRGRPKKPPGAPKTVPREGVKLGRPTKEEVAERKRLAKNAKISKTKKGKTAKNRKVITTRDIMDANIARRTQRDGRLVEELSPREKAAIIYGLIYNPEATQYALWEMAVDYKSDDATDGTKKGYASRWYNSAPIVIFREQFLAQYEKVTQQKIDAALAVQKEQLMLKFGQIDPDEIDYTKPDAQKKLLNHIINSSDEGKEKLDALKAVISMQKDDREAARDNKVQRFYMPLKCTECPLHARAEKNREKKLRQKEALEKAKLEAEEAAREAGEEFDESKYEMSEEDEDAELDEALSPDNPYLDTETYETQEEPDDEPDDGDPDNDPDND